MLRLYLTPLGQIAEHFYLPHCIRYLYNHRIHCIHHSLALFIIYFEIWATFFKNLPFSGLNTLKFYSCEFLPKLNVEPYFLSEDIDHQKSFWKMWHTRQNKLKTSCTATFKHPSDNKNLPLLLQEYLLHAAMGQIWSITEKPYWSA